MHILAPIEYLLLFVFSTSYKLIHNYGLSLMVMSLVITVGTYPLYHLADIWKKKEDDVQLLMADDIKKIKRAYDGQKRFYLMQTTYRLYNYKSWYAFRTSLGLLIQIPFFFAAYNVLSKYEGYAGHSFLFINDLSQPDALFFGVNVLPIIMTLVNLISSVVYSRSFKIKDNLQLIILAAVFLVFLYNSPAALLIYWTCNNLLSLFKSYFLNKKKEMKYPDQKEKDLLLHFGKIFIVCLSFFTQLFLVIKISMSKYFIVLGIFVIGMFVLALKRGILKTIKNNIFNIVLLVVFSLIFVLNIDFNSLHLKLLSIPAILLSLHLILLEMLLDDKDKLIFKDVDINRSMLFATGIIFSFTLIVLLPQLLYVKGAEEANCSFFNILLINLGVELIVVGLLFLGFKFFPKVKIYKLEILLNVLLLGLIFNTYCFPLDTGVISGFALTNFHSFYSVTVGRFLLDISIACCIVVICYFLMKKQKFSLYLAIILCGLNVWLVLYNTVKERKIVFAEGNSYQKETSPELDKVVYDNHSFSKNKPNVIYIVADMFNSEYISQISEEMDNFNEVFEGFTWYKDTLSISGWTNTSLPALFAGSYYEPLKMLERGEPVLDATDKAMEKMKENYESAGFRFSYVGDLGVESGMPPYTPYYCDRNGIRLESNISKRKLLTVLPIFNMSPVLIKKYIYNNGSWLIYSRKLEYEFNRENALKSLSYLALLPEISSSNSDRSNFLFFRTELSHTPYGIDKNGNLIGDYYPDETEKSFVSSKAAYYSGKKTIELLADYFMWLKENDLYDNTLIVVCSDHGNNCFDNGIPTNSDENPLWKSRANALFMIKPINSKIPFTVDEKTPESNANIAKIILDDLGIANDLELHETESGKRKYVFMKSINQLVQRSEQMDYVIYNVEGNIYDDSSWSLISK